MKLRDENKYEDRIFEAEEEVMYGFHYPPDFESSLKDKQRLDLLEKGKFDLIKYNKITKNWGILDSEDGFLYASDSSLRRCIDKLFGIF